MRFKLGFALGFAAGHWVASTPPDQRRAKLDEAVTGVRSNPRLRRITDTVARDARRLGDAVEERFVKTTDGAANALAGSVEPANGSSLGGGPSSVGGGPSLPTQPGTV
jgi:hypothetical protein